MQAEKESKEMDTHRKIVEGAERLFRQLGFQKTTVADIARELHMSPANVYRFFGGKSEINAAVCMDLLGKIEAEAGKIAASRGTAAQRMRILVASVEKAHSKLYMSDRKLHELSVTRPRMPPPSSARFMSACEASGETLVFAA